VQSLAFILDVQAIVREQKQFKSACMAVCNEICSHFKAEQVSIGWLKGSYIKLQALSNKKDFDSKMELVRDLENAMDETVSMEQEIVFPDERFNLVYGHKKLLSSCNIPYMVSIPVHCNRNVVAVVLLQRTHKPFDEQELVSLRLVVESISPYLSFLKTKELSVLKRFFTGIRQKISDNFGLEKPYLTLGAILGGVLLIWMFFGSFEHQVSAPFIIRSDQRAMITSPMNGYIKELSVRVGDRVKKAQVLALMDTAEHQIRKQELIAEKLRWETEKNIASSKQKFGQMAVAKAQMEKFEASLSKINYFLDSAKIKSPLDGVVTEDNELFKKLGIAVSKGQPLFRVDSLSDFYVELQIAEFDLRFVKADSSGTLKFISDMNKEVSFKIEFIEPVVIQKEGKNIVRSRASIKGDELQWLRVGMSGNGKIKAGFKSPIWLLTHKLVDWVLLKWF
jgi:multidrug resistance efflux pump